MRTLVSVAVLIAVAATASAAGPIADGKWLLFAVTPAGETAQYIVKIETTDGKPSASLLYSPPPPTGRGNAGARAPRVIPITIQNFRQTGNEISFEVAQGNSIRTFVGILGADEKRVLGSLGTDASSTRAVLTTTDKEKFEGEERVVRSPAAEAYANATQLAIKASLIRSRARTEKDEEKKAQLLKEVAAAQKEADANLPGLYRDVLARFKETPATFDAATALVRMAGKTKATADDVIGWVTLIEKQAALYGPRFARQTAIQTADALADETAFAPTALRLIDPVVQAIKDSDKASDQVKLLTVQRTALESLGKIEELKQIVARIERLDTKLDAEYLASVPPFKPEPYPGRKEKGANKVAVMELFTGAQCPPCVAADVAFDALAKSYKPTDVVLLQYHLHIPGPDPLTNRDTLGRAEYYDVHSTPSTLFDGKSQAGGGGGMEAARQKYNQYVDILDAMLEKATDVKVAGTFGRAGDRLTANVTVTGADPSAELKLRLVVVEETIKYVGSNQIRFHHEVVRAMIGGPAGVAVNDKAFKHSAAADIDEIKKGLTGYLDEFAATTKFPSKKRPMDLGHLKVFALVQNDKTKEIVQAVPLDAVGGKTSVAVDQK
jgi:hypothetical protein